jgi:hypothetical protein
MIERQNVRLVQQFYAAFKGGDITSALRTLADDVDWFIPGPEDISSFAGQRQGHEQVAQFIAKLAQAQEAEQFEPRDRRLIMQATRPNWNENSFFKRFAVGEYFGYHRRCGQLPEQTFRTRHPPLHPGPGCTNAKCFEPSIRLTRGAVVRRMGWLFLRTVLAAIFGGCAAN